MTDIIDQLLADFRPKADDPTVREGLMRGRDIRDISDAEDNGLLDEIAPGGEHNPANSGGTSGIVAAQEDWRESASKPFTAEDSVMTDVLKQGSAEDGEECPFDESESVPGHMASVKARIAALLHIGQTPRQVTAYLNRIAELEAFDRTESDSYLQDQAGLMGYAYLEPNHFNQKSCVASMRHIQATGVIRAKSVKRITACEGCDQCKPDHEGGCKCATYGLPIVSNPQEMASVIASITGKKAKKAALVEAHNGTHGEVLPGHAVIAIQQGSPRDTTQTIAGAGVITRFDAQAVRQAAAKFSSADVHAQLKAGKMFGDIYAEQKKIMGSAKTEQVLRSFLDTLKKTGTRLNVAAIDCKLLRKRLTASETLLGTTKCATCTARGGMHCGLTGGTILSYPGMGPQGRKQASMDAEDGVTTMDSMELRAPEMIIDIKTDRDLLDVEMPLIAPLSF